MSALGAEKVPLSVQKISELKFKAIHDYIFAVL